MSEQANGLQGVKTCPKCKKTKPLTEFYFRNKALGTYRPECKECRKAYLESRKDIIREQRRQGRIKNADKIREQKHKSYIKNKDTILAKSKERYEANAEAIKARQREYNEANRELINQRQAEYYENNKEERQAKQREYYKEHADERNAYNKEWANKNKEYLREYNRQYQKDNKEKIDAQRKVYNAKNADKLRAWRRENKKRRKTVDPLYRLSEQARTLINNSFRRQGYKKGSRTYQILGCDFETLYNHLMQTWFDNYGTEWNDEPYHIDHIKPIARARTEQEVLELCHYTNLQMLKPEDNLAKSDKLEWQVKKGGSDE